MDLFVDGSVHAVLAADDLRLLAYERVLGERRALVAFNASDRAATLTLPLPEGTYRAAYPAGGEEREVTGDSLRLDLAPLSAQVWIRSGREP